jgi:hypothetical protein
MIMQCQKKFLQISEYENLTSTWRLAPAATLSNGEDDDETRGGYARKEPEW